MRSKKILWLLLISLLTLSNTSLADDVVDNTAPEVTARVSRISFIEGEIQVKRADSQNWEKATMNLPLVEGDQIATGGAGRAEIQFDSANFLRLAENSYLKIVTLRDEGIALSLPEGTLSLRVLTFDKNRTYFEIDAPKTTISVQQAGLYRVDSGTQNQQEVRVTVTDSGQARVYSDNSGFTVKNGRSAKLFIDGSFAGEWETGDASRYVDEWDAFVLKRDTLTAKRLERAAYDKYYDREMYGAEDLSDYGEWVYTRKYGYVWRPYRSSVSRYSNWSPYRYGHWRWIPPYGYVWIYVDNEWCWTPYTYYRTRRSWWRPAHVVLIAVGGNYCWYPLGYYDNYYNYNYHYYRGRGRGNNTTIINNNTTVIVNNGPNQNPTPSQPTAVFSQDPRSPNTVGQIQKMLPPGAVVTMPANEFGKGFGGVKPAPLEMANQVLAKDVKNQTPPILPDFNPADNKVRSTIITKEPTVIRNQPDVQIGAAKREKGLSMDESLQNEKVYGNRKPSPKSEPQTPLNGSGETGSKRSTGAVDRTSPPIFNSSDSDSKSNTTQRSKPRQPADIPTGSGNSDSTEQRKPRSLPNDDTQTPPIAPEERKPRYNPPKREEPRYEPPPKREEPRYESPKRQEPRYEPPPKREEPRYEPPKRQEPPPPPPPSPKTESPSGKNPKDNKMKR
jgi:hypothetical protein